MLNLQYSLTKEDYVNYYTYVVWDAPENNRKRFIYYARQLVPILLFIAAFYYTGLFKRDSLFILIIVGFILLTTLLSLLGVRTNTMKQAEKVADNPANQSFFKPTELTVSDTGITIKTDLTETRYQWKAFIKKQESKQYYFLFTSGIQGIIIPRRIFRNEDERIQFEKILQQQLSFEAELGHLVRS